MKNRFILVALLCVAMLSGCTSKEGEETYIEENSTTTEAVAENNDITDDTQEETKDKDESENDKDSEVETANKNAINKNSSSDKTASANSSSSNSSSNKTTSTNSSISKTSNSNSNNNSSNKDKTSNSNSNNSSSNTTTEKEETNDNSIKNGTYSISVSLSGGSGRASIESPTKITISNGNMTATIKWSSSNYSYMIVNGKKYYPVNSSGNSTFKIPVSQLDKSISVSAETTAMSEPHIIDYTLFFDSSSMK